MRQFAPGRVSYRYARNGRRDRLWVEPPLPRGRQHSNSRRSATSMWSWSPRHREAHRLVQPQTLKARRRRRRRRIRRTAEWNWRWRFATMVIPSCWTCLAEPPGRRLSRIRGVHPSASLCTNRVALRRRFRGRTQCRRRSAQYAHAVDSDGRGRQRRISSTSTALSLTVRLPASVPTSPALLQSLRVARMEFLIRTGDRLVELVPSVFTREWLHQILLSVSVVESQAHSHRGHPGRLVRRSTADADAASGARSLRSTRHW